VTTLDPRIAAGTARMLERRDTELARGARHLGWKLGFGAPAALARFGTDRPLVGFLVDSRVVDDGATVSLDGWTRPVLEAEVAVHVGGLLGAGCTPEEAANAVTGWSVAIELADLDQPPEDIGEILAGNIYHRHVVLGRRVPPLLAAPTFAVRRDGDEVAATEDPTALTGDLPAILASAADTLAAAGAAGLSTGDVVITGSVVPPIEVGPGRWTVEAVGLGRVSVDLV
jgi:2-keto-4-pentenoate hydratase